MPTAARLGLLRLLQAQPNLRVHSAGPEDLLSHVRRLRPGLLVVGEQQLREVEQLSRYAAVPTLLYCEAPPLPGVLPAAARWGVRDVLRPPTCGPDWAGDVLRKVRAALPSVPAKVAATGAAPVPFLPSGIVVIGGSTGSPAAVEQLVRQLPATLRCAVLVAVHLPAAFQTSFVERLRRATALPVVAATVGTRLEPGRIAVAPGGRNLVVRPITAGPWQAWQTDFTPEAGPTGDEPSVDVLMQSAARVAGPNVLGVVLTGLGCDGTAGAQAIRQHGGAVLVQNEATAAVFAMPKAVLQAGWADAALPLTELPAAVVRHAARFRRTGAVAHLCLSVPVAARAL